MIEVMGLAILPGRLKTEFKALAQAVLQGKDIRTDEALAKHADWMDELKSKYDSFKGKSEEEIIDIIKKETGIVFSKVLEHAGVYKCNAEGQSAFERFIESIE